MVERRQKTLCAPRRGCRADQRVVAGQRGPQWGPFLGGRLATARVWRSSQAQRPACRRDNANIAQTALEQ